MTPVLFWIYIRYFLYISIILKVLKVVTITKKQQPKTAIEMDSKYQKPGRQQEAEGIIIY